MLEAAEAAVPSPGEWMFRTSVWWQSGTSPRWSPSVCWLCRSRRQLTIKNILVGRLRGHTGWTMNYKPCLLYPSSSEWTQQSRNRSFVTGTPASATDKNSLNSMYSSVYVSTDWQLCANVLLRVVYNEVKVKLCLSVVNIEEIPLFLISS